MRVLVLGGTGMLGSMTAKVLAEDGHEVILTARRSSPYPYDGSSIRWRRFAVDETAWLEVLRPLVDGCDQVVNCLGATKPLMGEDAAYTCNAHFPHALVDLGKPLIHVSTDCVFPGSGDCPPHEDTPATATDDYGRSKAEGEPHGALVLRCSLIGPECREPARHLLGSVVEGRVTVGYCNHLWNGITTLHWARIVRGLIESGDTGVSLIHLVPGGSASKDRLVSTILQAFGWYREVEPLCVSVREPSDMRLSTVHGALGLKLWSQAGYDWPPGIEQMVWELAEFCARERWPPEGWRYWRCGR